MIAVLGTATASWVLARRLPADVVPVISSRWWLGAGFAVLSILAVALTARLSVFMWTGTRGYAQFPWDDNTSHHWCASAYLEGARYNQDGLSNVYDPKLYSGRTIAEFTVDEYEYPPPFLLIARAVQASAPEVTIFRARWFVIEAGLLAFALVMFAFWLKRPEVWLALPLIWIAPLTQVTLQFGNFHLLVIAIALLAMMAFEDGRTWLGGLLLAIAIVTKIFPGILLLWLLLRRRWTAVRWTVGTCVALTALAAIVVGLEPFQAFLTSHLPRVLSGEAFPGLESGRRVATNISLFSIPFRLEALGVPGMSRMIASGLMLVSALVLLASVFRASRRPPRDRFGEVCLWLALLYLGSVQNAFAPIAYVGLPLLLALVFRLSNPAEGSRGLILLALIVVAVTGQVGTLVSMPEVVRQLTSVAALAVGLVLGYQEMWQDRCRRGSPIQRVKPCSTA